MSALAVDDMPKDLSYDQAFELCEALVAGAYSDDVAARLLIALAENGESAAAIHGFVACLASHAERIPYEAPTMDVCGTGGTGLTRFNVSTTVAFLLAADGLCVAKHGNRGSRAPNGSFDLLERLGVPVDLGPQSVATCLQETGLGFIYARRFHPAMRRVAAARALAGRRTIFNLAGPLSNPTNVATQVVGVASSRDAKTIAEVLTLLGRRRGLALTGSSGMDDVDLTGPISIHVAGETFAERQLDPLTIGLPRVALLEVPGGDADVNAELFALLLTDQAPPSLRDTVCLSAAIAMVAARPELSIAAGYERARHLLATGKVREKFETYRRVAVNAVERWG